MKPCVYCSQTIEDDSIVCRHCARQVPRDAVRLMHPGYRFGLGTTQTAYAIWDLTSSTPPIATFPVTQDGWDDAWFRFRQLEVDEAGVVPGEPPPIVVGADGPLPIYPRFGAEDAEPTNGRRYTVGAYACAALALILAPALLGIQIVFGPAGILLGAMGRSHGDPHGQRAIAASVVTMVLGILWVFALCADGSCR